MSDPAVETWRDATGPCPRGFKCGGDQEAGDCRCIEAAEHGPDTYNFDPPWVP